MDSIVELIPATVVLLFDLAVISVPIFLVARAIKRHSDRKFELEKYKAETERMKAEAEASKNAEEKL